MSFTLRRPHPANQRTLKSRGGSAGGTCFVFELGHDLLAAVPKGPLRGTAVVEQNVGGGYTTPSQGFNVSSLLSAPPLWQVSFFFLQTVRRRVTEHARLGSIRALPRKPELFFRDGRRVLRNSLHVGPWTVLCFPLGRFAGIALTLPANVVVGGGVPISRGFVVLLQATNKGAKNRKFIRPPWILRLRHPRRKLFCPQRGFSRWPSPRNGESGSDFGVASILARFSPVVDANVCD